MRVYNKQILANIGIVDNYIAVYCILRYINDILSSTAPSNWLLVPNCGKHHIADSFFFCTNNCNT